MIDRSKPILVFLARGVQGGAVMRAAIARGFRVRALVRASGTIAVKEGGAAEFAAADLDDAASLRSASEGIDHAVLQIPIGPADQMVAQAGRALAAFRNAGVRSFVLKLASASRPSPCEEPSFVANQMIEDMAAAAGIPFAIVRPTMYLDNLLKPSARAEIVRDGVFAPPIAASQRIAWTSADDCAAATLTLIERQAMGGDHRLAGPESLDGPELALALAAGLGRTIRYHSQPIAAFEQEVEAAMGAGLDRRVASKFRYFEEHPDEAEAILAVPFKPEAGLEDFIPTSVRDWAGQHRSAFAGEPATG